MDEKSIKARQVYDTMCAALDEMNWHYRRDDENLRVLSGARGDDIPMELTFRIDAERQIIILFSGMPFNIEEDKRLITAVAVCAANDKIIDGFFDYDIKSGRIYFKITSSYIDCEVGKDVFSYMLVIATRTIDDYNDKFLRLSSGTIGLEDFIS